MTYYLWNSQFSTKLMSKFSIFQEEAEKSDLIKFSTNNVGWKNAYQDSHTKVSL